MTKSVPILGCIKDTVALFTAPSIVDLRDFLVAAFSRTSRVHAVVLFDMRNSSNKFEIGSLIVTMRDQFCGVGNLSKVLPHPFPSFRQ